MESFCRQKWAGEGIIIKRQRVVSGTVTFPWEGRGSHHAGHRLVVMRVVMRQFQAEVGNPTAGEGCNASEVGMESWWSTAMTLHNLSLGKYKVKVTYVRNFFLSRQSLTELKLSICTWNLGFSFIWTVFG